MQPPKYQREYAFKRDDPDQTNHAQLDEELDNAAQSINGLRGNLAQLQRDDGALRDGLVDADTLAPAFRADLKRELHQGIHADVAASQAAAQQAQASEQNARASEQHSAQSGQIAIEQAREAQQSAVGAHACADSARADAKEVRRLLDDVKEIGTPADHSVSEIKLIDEAVTRRALANQAVDETKLADRAVTAAKLANESVTADKIGFRAVNGFKLAPGAVAEDTLADAAVTTQKIADQSVTPQKLADKAVTTQKLADQSVTENALADQSVKAQKIAPGAVTQDKLCGPLTATPRLDLHNPDDGSTRTLQNAHGKCQVLGADGNVQFTVLDDGTLSAGAYGQLHSYFATRTELGGKTDQGWVVNQLNSKANAGAECQHNSVVVEFGTQAGVVPPPYVVVGVNSLGGFHLLGIKLRNQ